MILLHDLSFLLSKTHPKRIMMLLDFEKYRLKR